MKIPKVDLLLLILGLEDFVNYLPLMKRQSSYFPDFKISKKNNMKKRNKSHYKIINWQLIKKK